MSNIGIILFSVLFSVLKAVDELTHDIMQCSLVGRSYCSLPCNMHAHHGLLRAHALKIGNQFKVS